jgi:hypothetical protein
MLSPANQINYNLMHSVDSIGSYQNISNMATSNLLKRIFSLPGKLIFNICVSSCNVFSINILRAVTIAGFKDAECLKL